MDDQGLLELLVAATGAVRVALDGLEDWGPAGTRPGQYRLDLAADDAALRVLRGGGLAVLSEESGLSPGRPGSMLAVLDPVDSSTNAHLGLPFYATSICVLDQEGLESGSCSTRQPATARTRSEVRGPVGTGNQSATSGASSIGEAVIGISGFPHCHPGWSQFRAIGAASLELYGEVADGSLDGYMVVGGSHLFPWDYLAAALICHEAGAVVVDRDDKDLVARDGDPRRPAAAATRALLDQLVTSGA